MKLYCILFYVFLVLVLHPAVCFSQTSNELKCIVIDAGHGGKDPGAVNGKLYEKNITLAVAKKLGALLAVKYPNIKVLHTRSDDSFVALQDRCQFANKNNADLFISIHTNAAKSSQASGTETYIMGVDKSGANLAVAMRENDVIIFESDYSTRYEGFEPGSAESFIIFSLMNYAHQSRSLQMANLLQKYFAENLPMKNRGVKQAGYLVLWQATMPSILTEIGFISNPTESQYLASTEGQNQIAGQVMNALESYINQYQKNVIKTNVQTPAIKNTPAKAQASEINDLYYSILAISSNEKITITSKNFGQFVSVVTEKKDGKIYKYYIDKVFSYKEALLLQSKVQKIIRTSYIVAFEEGKEVSIEKAKKIKP